MLYYLVRPLVRHVLRFYLGGIEIDGLEHIPKDAAVILAANHPTAFIEPCVMACFQPRPLRFLARGNLYKNTLATTVLRALHILPVYRWEDGGFGKLKDNFATFRECHRALARRQAIMILAEGRCIHEKRLRPLRRGTARIALAALDGDPTLGEVYVVPVGVNFTAADRWWSDVLIRCGPPLRSSDYLIDYRTAEAATLRRFTKELRAALSPHVIQLTPPGADEAGNLALEVGRNAWQVVAPTSSAPEGGALRFGREAVPSDYGVHTVLPPGSQLDAELRIAVKLSGNHVNSDYYAVSRIYAAKLHQHGITDAAVAGVEDGRAARFSVARLLVAGCLLLPWSPLFFIAEWVAKRFPTTIEFYSPVRFAALTIGALLFIPALLLASWPLKIWLLLSFLLVNWALTQVRCFFSWRAVRRVAQLGPDTLRELRELRRGILQRITP